jgi:hypothetical protein
MIGLDGMARPLSGLVALLPVTIAGPPPFG